MIGLHTQQRQIVRDDTLQDRILVSILQSQPLHATRFYITRRILQLALESHIVRLFHSYDSIEWHDMTTMRTLVVIIETCDLHVDLVRSHAHVHFGHGRVTLAHRHRIDRLTRVRARLAQRFDRERQLGSRRVLVCQRSAIFCP